MRHRQILCRYLDCMTFPARQSSSEPVIGIRRETINAWERRAPFAPSHVRQLTSRGIRVLVQPSNRRAYPMQEYQTAGAEVVQDLSQADIIMGVKTVPIDQLIEDKTYCFFSHVIKAQLENMPLLDALLEKRIRLLDYEKMTSREGKRLVAFGKWAGFAGMIDILHGLGLRLLALGHHTPFVHIGLAHNYRDSHMARNAIRDAGYSIARGLMPASLGPLTFVFTGSGNVSKGAQEIFQDLPHEYVDPHRLPAVAKHGNPAKVYACQMSRRDYLVRKEGGRFDAGEYDEFPDRYESIFAEKIAPHASVIVNGIFWSPNSPRLITIPDAKKLLSPSRRTDFDVEGCPTLPHRLIAICDISADPGGSIEFMHDCTTIDKPFCIYDADEHLNSENFDDPTGALVCSIDNMPAQMPLEATDYFGDRLMPFIDDILKSDAKEPFAQYQASARREVTDAIIASNGRLTPNFEYITPLRKEKMAAQRRGSGSTGSGKGVGGIIADIDSLPRVLILGAGMVSAPVIELLTRNNDTRVTVASELQSDADRLLRHSHAHDLFSSEVLAVDGRTESNEKLTALIDQHNVVVSLLPYALHPQIARMCIRQKTHLVTASYASDEMMSLHNDALAADITLMNEVGLDPGIDHFLAMQSFDNAHKHGGRIISFESFCGGLPAPEFAENPLRYKFSWSPRGVLLNTLSPARYLKQGNIVEVKPDGAILDALYPINFQPGFSLEGFPNRDSTKYADTYGLKYAHTLIRGTLRYRGFTDAMKALLELGLIDTAPHVALDPDSGPHLTWKEFIAVLLQQKPDIFADSLRDLVRERVGSDSRFEAIDGLGLFSESELVARKRTPIDALTDHLATHLQLGPDERDVCIMRHDIGIEYAGGKQEIEHVDFVAYGEAGGNSGMARTVGLTAALTARMLLQGEIQQRGVVLPMRTEIYRPLLLRLAQEGLVARVTRTEL